MNKTAAYRVTDESQLTEYNAKGTRYEHIRTGCDIFHVACEDEENLFAFIFPTPPSDSAGLPHIVEHSVLSGSKSYPVKDPFAQLMQGSMNTFLNAMTYPDKTIYPASSLVESDFFNLLKVYGDAVFFPLLKEEIFLQEGHHLHLAEDREIVHGGVVYNEMKGNYSSIESIAGEWTTRSLFSESSYRFDSGGEPLEIAGLSYGNFLDFYRTFYHPSNGKIFLYGNIPPEKILSYLDSEILSSFDAGEKAARIVPEPKWNAPKRIVVTAPISEKSETKKRDMLFINWLADTVTDPLHLLTMEVISEILFGNHGAPLYQSIIESGIAQDVSPRSGTDTNLLQAVFTAGVRGTSAEKEQAFETLIFNTLNEINRNGLPREVVRGALNRVEFRNREKRSGIPFGLRLLGRSLRGWLHGLPPDETMRFTPWFEKLTDEYRRNNRYFEEQIQRHLIENPHRSTVIITGDPANRTPEVEIDGKDETTRQRAERETLLFNEFQKKNDSPEDIARIPVLKREDVPKKVEIIPTEESLLKTGQRLFTHALDTNGIVYVDIGFPLNRLTLEEQYFMPLFTKGLYKIGCKGMAYDVLARRIFEETGGFSSYLEGSTTPEGTKLFVFFRLKTLETKLEKGLSLAERILTVPDLANTEKCKDILLEMRNDAGASIIPRGNHYAFLTAARNLQAALGIEEVWKGVDQLFFLDHLTKLPAADFSRISGVFRSFLKKILYAKDSVVHVCAERSFLKKAVTAAENVIACLPSSPADDGNEGADLAAYTSFFRTPPAGAKPVCLAVPSSVGFAASGIRGSWLGTKGNAVESILAHALKTGYLWEQVRLKGGAYGVSAIANGSEGMYAFTSYRDPNCVKSLTTFREALEFAAAGKIETAILEKAIIGTVGKDVTRLQPGAKGFIGFRRMLYGISDEIRQRKRDYILSIGPRDLSHAAEKLLDHFRYAETALIAGDKMLREVNSHKPERIMYLPV